MILSTSDLHWDDLLDDFEDRIDDLWSALDDGGELETRAFVPPDGSAGAITPVQQSRLASLQSDAAEAAAELTKRLEANRAESSSLHLGSKARRTYVGAKRLGR